jgi:hypothetical protein
MANFLDAKTLSMIQAAQNARSANRSGKSGPRLLDDNESNIGNNVTLQPQVLPVGSPVPFTTLPLPGPPRLINLTSASKTGQSMTLVMTAARVANQQGVAGPITGLVEFGNGTQSVRAEFDIPFGPFIGSINGVLAGTQPEDGGALVQVPTGILRAYARYDNLYITPNLQGFAFGGPGSSFVLPPGAGPYPPNNAVPPLASNYGSTPAIVKAFAAYFGRIHSKLYRTLYLYNGNTAIPVAFGNPIRGVDITTTYAIPPFAKSVQVIRTPFSSAMIMILSDLVSVSGAGLGGYINIPAGQQAPIIPIVGNQTVVGVCSASAGDKVSAVSLVFEIGF